MFDLVDPNAQALALRDDVPRPPARWERRLRLFAEAGTRGSTVRGVALLGTLAIAMWIIGAGWLTPWVVSAGVAHYGVALGLSTARAARDERARGALAYPIAPEVEVAEIGAPDLRTLYAAILRLHEDIRISLVDAPRIQEPLHDVFARCGAVVRFAGRIARVGNPLHRYLATHAPWQTRAELDRLAIVEGVAGDPMVQGAYRGAIAARGRQLGTLSEILTLRDRIRGRLELIAAALESVAALVIKLQVLDLEQVELAGPLVADELESLGDELTVLETTIEEDV